MSHLVTPTDKTQETDLGLTLVVGLVAEKTMTHTPETGDLTLRGLTGVIPEIGLTGVETEASLRLENPLGTEDSPKIEATQETGTGLTPETEIGLMTETRLTPRIGLTQKIETDPILETEIGLFPETEGILVQDSLTAGNLGLKAETGLTRIETDPGLALSLMIRPEDALLVPETGTVGHQTMLRTGLFQKTEPKVGKGLQTQGDFILK